MSTQIRVAVVFGGTNTEHEVSLQSASGIISNLDKNKFQIIPITITKKNIWQTKEGRVLNPFELTTLCDIVFPVLHGPYGEDGTVQGMLELMHIPYVGCGVTASAVCMDKVLQKNICRDYEIPVAPFFWLTVGDWQTRREITTKHLLKKFDNSYPLFVKPANQGSSVGVTKAHNQEELIAGIETALTRDTKVIIEVAVPNVREIECAVLGNHDPQTSVLGEIIPGNEFYDYNAKYIDDNSIPVIPADLPNDLSEKIRASARLAFQALDCSGMARADFFIDKETNEYYLSELNTIPGFTPISMYPKLWEASGISYKTLLTKLIELGLERHTQRTKLNLSL